MRNLDVATASQISLNNKMIFNKASILTQVVCPNDYRLLRVHAPWIADNAKPGNHVLLQADDTSNSERPLAITRIHPPSGQAEMLYRVCDDATRTLATKTQGDAILLGTPHGHTVAFDATRERALLIGSGNGLAPTLFLANEIARLKNNVKPLVLFDALEAMPFTPAPSRLLVSGLPPGVIATLPLLDEMNIPCRLASHEDRPGCFEGEIVELARCWLSNLSSIMRDEIEIVVCGPRSTIDAAMQLAQQFQLSLQCATCE